MAVGVVFMLSVGSASAEVRSGSVTDPADAAVHLNVDGTSYRDQDIQRVTASYDTAGSITMTFYFLDPVPASTPDTLKAIFSPASCNYITGAALVTVFPSSSKYDSANVGVSGYEGTFQATRTLSADHRAITVQASAPVLANRDYTCVNSIALWHSYEHFHCDYYNPPYTCSDYAIATTDATDAFSIDAATPLFPIPDAEATVAETPEATDTSSDRCGAARTALRKKQKQMKKLRAQRRSTQKRKRKISLTKQIQKTRRGIAKTRAVIVEHC